MARQPAAADAPYLIKKYSSRRLYDVAAGRFVTLDELYSLIREGRRIKAVDAKGQDITRAVLMQILAEREEDGQPLLSIDVLHEMVRMYDDVMQSLFVRFIEEGVGDLLRQQRSWQSGMQQALQRGTTAAMGELFSQQKKLWDVSQNALLGALTGKAPAESPSAAKPAAAKKPRKPRS